MVPPRPPPRSRCAGALRRARVSGAIIPDRAVRRRSRPRRASDRHHLPRRAARVADRERQEAAADQQRRRRPGRARSTSSTSCGSPSPRRSGPAKRINSEGERIIEKAQEEAERIVARAQEQAAFLIEERGLTEAAEEESGRIVAQRPGATAEEIRRGADEYAASVLIGLEGDVVRTLQSIKKGIAMLDERRPRDLIEPPEPSDDDDASTIWGRVDAGEEDAAAVPLRGRA